MSMIHQVRLQVIGSVIGVGFRAWCRMQALEHRVTGWVRNNEDRDDIYGPQGGVEIVAQAEEADLMAFIEEIKKGSPIARVQQVHINPEVPKQKFDEFVIKRTV